MSLWEFPKKGCEELQAWHVEMFSLSCNRKILLHNLMRYVISGSEVASKVQGNFYPSAVDEANVGGITMTNCFWGLADNTALVATPMVATGAP